MKSTVSALFGLVFLAGLPVAQAQLRWEKTQIDLTPKAGDQEAVANFKYENTGKTPITIKNVKSSCGCTTAALKKNDVAPGEKGEVTATFKIGGRTGVQQKTVTVETDDPSQPSITLMLKATIATPLELKPSFVYWESGEKPTPKTMTAKVGADVTVTKLDVNSSSPDFKTAVTKSEDGKEFVITVTPTDTSKVVNATLTIKSNLPEPLYAMARITGPANAPAAAPVNN